MFNSHRVGIPREAHGWRFDYVAHIGAAGILDYIPTLHHVGSYDPYFNPAILLGRFQESGAPNMDPK